MWTHHVPLVPVSSAESFVGCLASVEVHNLYLQQLEHREHKDQADDYAE